MILRANARGSLRTRPSSRAAAAALTALLYACLALLVGRHGFWILPVEPAPSEAMLALLPDASRTIRVPPSTPFIARLTRPRAQTIALPDFTIASDAPAARAELSVTTVKPTPLDAGAPQGTRTAAQLASANGTGGNGTAFAACLDAAWMRAVTDHVRQFYYQPKAIGHFPMTGLVFVHLVVAKDGSLLKSDIGKSSGSDPLDQFALSMLRRAAPLPAIPERMHVTQFEGLLPIYFGDAGRGLNPTPGDCA